MKKYDYSIFVFTMVIIVGFLALGIEYLNHMIFSFLALSITGITIVIDLFLAIRKL
ncbi:hypothetical protein SAMN05446037_101648 [Anaerovirgula multivorans]|uniref:Uncharacterized protein n=1 Tax=Anaerovirgula multivorans TaxID=312168 RepID=A0A239GD26_9FIRM|nr:hypothetical protein [Anaerovirgula multivorans]SNS66961.1 hypothetical protein SAMN05446037_101648 [Anaerovirgula multivorans]